MYAMIFATGLTLAAAAAWLAILTLPMSQAVRVRNAFLLRRGQPDAFNWTPAAVPADFRLERDPAPAGIEVAVKASGASDARDDWQCALALVHMLIRSARDEGGIRADLATTFQAILAGYGYCADYVRVFMAACRSVDLFSRQWAFSFDGFGGHGHTFVEIYDRQRSKWLFIDVHNNVYAAIAGAKDPIDALTLREALLHAPESITFQRATPARLGFPHFDKLLDYYRRGANEWYLWWGNDVITRERSGLVGAGRRISGRVAHRIANAIGQLPSLVVLATADNEPSIVRMERLRRLVLAAALSCAGSAALLALLLIWYLGFRHA